MTQAKKHIALSTTDTIPGLPGKTVTGSAFTWAMKEKLHEAEEALREWAIKGGYDAVVGVRIERTPLVWGNSPHRVQTDFAYLIYGTAVKYGT